MSLHTKARPMCKFDTNIRNKLNKIINFYLGKRRLTHVRNRLIWIENSHGIIENTNFTIKRIKGILHDKYNLTNATSFIYKYNMAKWSSYKSSRQRVK